MSDEPQNKPHFSDLISSSGDKPHLNPLARSINAPRSRKLAITAACAHCMGCTVDHEEPGWRKTVKECSSYSCPLWRFRPFYR